MTGNVTSVGGTAIGAMQGTLVQGDLVVGGSSVPAMESIPAPPGLDRVPVVSGLFVGRSSELERLDAAVAGSGRAVVVAVHGLGGVGKSTLAAHFAHHHTDHYTLVWWITADSPTAIDTGLADLATTLAPQAADLPLEQRTELCMRWLATHDGWLLVLDNLTTPADAAGLLERVRTGTIVITSRQGGGWRGVNTIPLNVLLPAEAVELLARIVQEEWPDPDMTDADRLCEELGWLPLAVEQAGAYLAQTRITPAAYLDLLRRYPARMFTATAESGDGRQTMARVWHVTLDRLADTPVAGQVLRLLAWCAPDAVPRAMLAALVNEPDLSEALGRLAAYSMITLTADTITVHRLVQSVTRTPDPNDAHRQPEDITLARDTAAAGLAAALDAHDPSDPAAWPVHQAVLPHARALFEHSRPDTDTPAVCQLLDILDRYVEVLATRVSIDFALISQGKAKEALANTTALLPVLDAMLDERHPTVLRERTTHGLAYSQLARFDEAVEALEHAHCGNLVALGITHPETLQTQFEYAIALKLRGRSGDIQRANTLFDEVRQRAKSVVDNRDERVFRAVVGATLARYMPAMLLRKAHRANHEHR